MPALHGEGSGRQLATTSATVSFTPTSNRLIEMGRHGLAKRLVLGQVAAEHFGQRHQPLIQRLGIVAGIGGDRHHAHGQRIAHVDGLALLVDAGDVAHPRRDPEARAGRTAGPP